jgi:20S proteasome subunit beta 6
MEVLSKTNSLSEVGVSYATQRSFNPYSWNGGTILAVAGPDFTVTASDTRLSEGFMIHSRDCPKIYRLTDKTVLLSTGFHGDVLTLTKIVVARLQMYEHEHNVPMSTSAIAAMLSTMLYYRRFFPYYVYNIVAGLDDEGKGCAYSYDPVGSYERHEYHAAGSAAAILQPLLDNQVGYKNQEGVEKVPLTREKANRLVRDVFISAAERDIMTGDGVRICIVTKDGITYEDMPLRKD